ncbi:MAG TPA: hypothetical protein VHQ94_06995 [Pyrinomonadaceae bacterium]|nr:hypothetical protein [Pyrinomonadaceae bacterium]
MRWLLCALIVLVSSQAVVCQTDTKTPPVPTKPTAAAEVVKKEPAFDPFVTRQVAEKLLSIDNVQTKSIGLARLASLIWKHDEEYARALFEKALDISNPQSKPSDGRLKIIHRNVISVIATKDAEWAKRLIDAPANVDERARNSVNINAALALIDSAPEQAVEFAQRALHDQFDPMFLQFLVTLRKTDQARADQTFLQVLRFLGQQSQPDIRSLHLIGLYLFTAPDMLDSDHYAMTLVDKIIVPNITVQRPGVSPALVRAYLTTSSSLLLRAATDTAQQQFTFTLGRLLLPKARSAAPDLVAQIEAAMAAVSADVPPAVTNESAFKYIDMTPPTPAESLANAERKPDQLSRDIAFLDVAASAWRKSDFKTVRKAASMIQDAEAGEALKLLVDFGEAAALLKSDAATVSTVEKVAYKLPAGLERALLLLAIGQNRIKSGGVSQVEEAIDASLKATSAVDNFHRPCLSVIAAGNLAQVRSSRTPFVIASTIKDLNSFAEVNCIDVDWTRQIKVGALESTFLLDGFGLNLNLDEALRAIYLSDFEIGFARAQELKNEPLRARALVEFVGAYLNKLEKDASQRKPRVETSRQPPK